MASDVLIHLIMFESLYNNSFYQTLSMYDNTLCTLDLWCIFLFKSPSHKQRKCSLPHYCLLNSISQLHAKWHHGPASRLGVGSRKTQLYTTWYPSKSTSFSSSSTSLLLVMTRVIMTRDRRDDISHKVSSLLSDLLFLKEAFMYRYNGSTFTDKKIEA